MGYVDLAAAQKRDLHLPANVFSIGYAGVEEGVFLSLDKGPDLLRPRDPSIAIGGAFIARDRYIDREQGPLGCIFHPAGAGIGRIYRTVVHTVVPEGKKAFSVLRTPPTERPSESLFKVDLSFPRGQKVKNVQGADGSEHALRVWSGIRTDGTIIASLDGESLVQLKDLQQLTIMFEDGFVRQVFQNGPEMEEVTLNYLDMAKLRIADAHLRLAHISPETWPDSVRREKATHYVLSGIVDLIHLSAKEDAVRKEIAQFFFNLQPELLQLIHRKLVAVLHQRDKVMAYAFTAPEKGVVVTPMKPVDPEVSRQKRAAADVKKAQRRSNDQAVRNASRGGSGGSNHQKQKGK